MKPKNDRIEQLFDSVNQAPTELSRSEMEAMIRGFDLVDAEPNVQPDSTLFFNLKNIIFMSLSILIAVGFYLFSPIQNGAEKTKSMSEVKTEITEQIKSEKTDDANMNMTSKKEIKESTEVSSSSTVIEFKKSLDAVKQQPMNTPKKAEDKSEKELLNRKENSSISQKKQSNVFDMKLEFQALKDSPAPHLSGYKMRKIKRRLYKNLQKDGFINSKDDFVEMDLLRTGIVVNGVEMDNALFLKYSGITEEAGTGSNRKIKMNSEYIRIGDFNPDGFKGSAFGTFRADYSLKDDVEQLPEMEELFSNEKERKKALLDAELKARDAFANDVMAESLQRTSRSRFFAPNLRNKEMKSLHAKLYQQLIKDSLLTNKDDFALLELNKKQILVNGQVLNTERFQTYSELISEFKIKFLPSRQIRLSAHSIAVGDYSIGSFSGTKTTFEFD